MNNRIEIHPEFIIVCSKLIDMLERFQEMKEGYREKIIPTVCRLGLFSTLIKQAYSVPYCDGSQQQDGKKRNQIECWQWS